MLSSLLTVVVICYDPYIDAIRFSNFFMAKNWSNISANVLYVGGSIGRNVCNYETATTGGDLSFSSRLSIALSNVKTKYLLILMDDYLINCPVDEKKIYENILFMERNNISFCELYTIFRRPKVKKKSNLFLKTSKNVRYRINLQPSIFSKDILLELLKMNPNTPWDAEMCFMDKKFNKYDAYFALNKSLSVVNYIDKGYVTRKAYKMLKNENIWNNNRPVLSVFREFLNSTKRFISYIVPDYFKNKIKGEKTFFKK